MGTFDIFPFEGKEVLLRTRCIIDIPSLIETDGLKAFNLSLILYQHHIRYSVILLHHQNNEKNLIET